jgi:tetratricopeptide (TPR) repeat protein
MADDSSEIAKLTERISKDPKSKLFVPLAEEYKKMGDIEMAIHVLSEGLKVNPSYVTARSFLGRLLLEQGDFAASQKEFEEVVKAIPDNLLAQKKLGDLHLLQSRQQEALEHYKIALALNPGDAEITSLISELESGVDTGAVVVQPNSRIPSDQTVLSPPESIQSSAGTLAPFSSSSPVSHGPVDEEPASEAMPEHMLDAIPGQAENEPVAEQPIAALPVESTHLSERPPDVAQQPITPVFEEEEAEEVFAVEPLDDQASLEAPKPAEINFFSEKVFDMNPAEEQEDAITASSGALTEEPVTADAEAQGDEITFPDFNAVIEEKTEPISPPEEQTFDQTGADDFTTDTLAELYIAQGFFEKAIDIYQRMLADKPNSRGLKDKLERVKAMAMPVSDEVATTSADDKTAPESTDEKGMFSEAKEFVPPTDTQEEEITLDAELFEPGKDLTESREPVKLERDIFTEAQEYRPENKPEEWTEPALGETDADALFKTPGEEKASSIPQYADFEPREYIPPSPQQQPVQEETGHPAPKSGSTANKATIERLEHWLNNIKKER